MNLFMDQIITPPASLPITVSDAQTDLAAAVVEEIERVHLWRGIVHQRRRIVVDGPLPSRIEIEPVSGILVSITRYTQADAAEVIPASTYNFVTRDPAGAIIIPAEGMNWPDPGTINRQLFDKLRLRLASNAGNRAPRGRRGERSSRLDSAHDPKGYRVSGRKWSGRFNNRQPHNRTRGLL